MRFDRNTITDITLSNFQLLKYGNFAFIQQQIYVIQIQKSSLEVHRCLFLVLSFGTWNLKAWNFIDGGPSPSSLRTGFGAWSYEQNSVKSIY